MHKYLLLKICFPVFLSLLTFRQSSAQPANFGKVSLEDLLQTHYTLDSSANAAILSDAGISYLEYWEGRGFIIRHERSVRIKIYNKEGLSWADVAVPYYTQDPRTIETVNNIKAYAYNIKDGEIARTEMQRDAVYNNKLSDKWSEKVFAVPDVKAGSVIEYQYTVNSPFLFNLRDWYFQYEIPVKWSEYEVKIPAFYEYQMLYQGYEPRVIDESEVLSKEQLGRYTYNRVRYKWALKNIPAFHNESFITTDEDYLAKITFQLAKVNYPGRVVKEYMTTWPKLIEDYLKISDAGKYLRKDDGEEIVHELIQAKNTDLEKARAIYDYIKINLAWNGENSIYPSQSPKKLLENKSGNCTDINIMLGNMLTMAGIEAKTALLSTRSHGHVNAKFPMIDEFNYSLVYARIGDDAYLLDATDPDLPMGMIPTHCINGYGLVMDADTEKEQWLTLYGGSEYGLTTNVICNYDTAQRKFIAKVVNNYSGYAASIKRKEIKHKDVVEVAAGKGLEIFKLKMDGLDKPDQSLRVSTEMPYDFEAMGENIYLSTGMFAQFDHQPFKAPERHFPIDYGYRHTYRYSFNLLIPEGYTVDGFPESEQILLDDKSVQFIWRTQASKMSVQVLSIMKINKPIISAEYYQDLQKIYSTMLAKYAERIMLKKIKT